MAFSFVSQRLPSVGLSSAAEACPAKFRRLVPQHCWFSFSRRSSRSNYSKPLEPLHRMRVLMSLAKPACRQTYISAPADRPQSRNWGNSLPQFYGTGSWKGGWVLAPQNCGSAAADFFSRKDAKKSNRSLPLAFLPQVGLSVLASCLSTGGLCVSASLRAIIFFSHADEVDLNPIATWSVPSACSPFRVSRFHFVASGSTSRLIGYTKTQSACLQALRLI